MVKVVQRGRFSIYVYAESGQPHHHPHCHVEWSDGSTVVRLPSGTRLAGDDLPTAARGLVNDAKGELIAAWNRLNPERPIK